MDQRQIEDILEWHNGRWRTPNRAKLLTNLTGIYESEGLIADGAPLALCRCCPSAEDCWRREQGRLPRVFPARNNDATGTTGESGSIFWPWIGEQYRPGGVSLVSLNINNAHADPGADDWWTIGVEYAIAEHALAGLGAGRRRILNSLFHYRAMSAALAVLASQDGFDPTEEPSPEEAAAALERIARVQAIKCSPSHDNSTPTVEMRANCPPRFAARELQVLAPGVLLSLGADARTLIDGLAKPTRTERGTQFHRGRLKLAGTEVELLALPHPTSRGRAWSLGLAELVASLRSAPASEADGP